MQILLPASRVTQEDKSTVREALHEPLGVPDTWMEQLFGSCQVELAEIERALGVPKFQLLDIGTCDQLRCIGHVMEVNMLSMGFNAFLEVPKHGGHVSPWSEWSSEDVEDGLLEVPDGGDTQYVVNIGDNRYAARWHKEDVRNVEVVNVESSLDIAGS